MRIKKEGKELLGKQGGPLELKNAYSVQWEVESKHCRKRVLEKNKELEV